MIIGVVNQKGGSGKSTLARLLAVEYARAEWRVVVADLDVDQATSSRWNERRMRNGFKPELSVAGFRVSEAVSESYDLLIFDGRPRSPQTLEVARVSDRILIPTGTAVDDMLPSVQLGHEMMQHRILKEIISIVFVRVGDSIPELEEARAYIQKAELSVLDNYLPERTAYRRASDIGKAATETPFKTLNAKADALVEEIASG